MEKDEYGNSATQIVDLLGALKKALRSRDHFYECSYDAEESELCGDRCICKHCKKRHPECTGGRS